jgi:UPF0755 protein
MLAWLTYATIVPMRPDGQKFVQVRSGTSVRQIARDLESAGVIRNRYAFLGLHYAAGRRSLKAGEYLFERSATAREVYDRIARGDVYYQTVVVPEGFNIFDIAQVLEAAKLCTRDEFLNVARAEVSLVADIDPQAKSLEGYLFPDTYNFGRQQSGKEMAAEMVRRFRKEAQSLGLVGNPQLHRIVTLASIIEKETSVEAERGVVASVFENRMTRGIGLATDPSVIYASLLIGKFDGTIRQSDLALDSPYNTYRHAGLPPGPIANPGRSSLVAAMHPEKTDYLYFVANNRGGHRFSRTLDEHNRNVAAYRSGRPN